MVYHFVVRRYGHILVEQTYAVENHALTDKVLLGSSDQFSIDPDPARNVILFPYEPITESKPESSGEEDESDEINNNSNESDNDTGEDGYENVQNAVEDMLNLVLENAMYNARNQKANRNYII